VQIRVIRGWHQDNPQHYAENEILQPQIAKIARIRVCTIRADSCHSWLIRNFLKLYQAASIFFVRKSVFAQYKNCIMNQGILTCNMNRGLIFRMDNITV
jgi:hypothetical protein